MDGNLNVAVCSVFAVANGHFPYARDRTIGKRNAPRSRLIAKANGPAVTMVACSGTVQKNQIKRRHG